MVSITIGRAFYTMLIKIKKIFTLSFYTFRISTPTLKLEMTIFAVRKR